MVLSKECHIFPSPFPCISFHIYWSLTLYRKPLKLPGLASAWWCWHTNVEAAEYLNDSHTLRSPTKLWSSCWVIFNTYICWGFLGNIDDDDYVKEFSSLTIKKRIKLNTISIEKSSSSSWNTLSQKLLLQKRKSYQRWHFWSSSSVKSQFSKKNVRTKKNLSYSASNIQKQEAKIKAQLLSSKHINLFFAEITPLLSTRILYLSKNPWENWCSKCSGWPACSSWLRGWRSATTCMNSAPEPLAQATMPRSTHLPPMPQTPVTTFQRCPLPTISAQTCQQYPASLHTAP